MNLEFFPHFIRANYPVIANETNEDLIEVGTKFKAYLEDKFKDNMDKIETVWDIDWLTVIKNQGHPFRTNGYHPALLIHFSDFVNKMKQEIKPE